MCGVHLAGKLLIFHSVFVVLDRPPEHEPSVIDVYLGKEQKLIKLPPKLARGLRRLLLNTPTTKTTSTSDDDDIWESCIKFWGGGETFMEFGDGFKHSHVTESLQLPEIGVEMFNAFKDWAIRKKHELAKTAQAYTIPGDDGGDVSRVKVSKRELQEELWTLMNGLPYIGNVRTNSDGEAEEVSDPDEDYGKEHSGFLQGALLRDTNPEPISKGWMVLY
jgi:hypothetical protein